jgi:hypothetical protein
LVGFAMRIEAEHGPGYAVLDGQEIPDIERDEVGNEEVNAPRRVNGAAPQPSHCGL